ncbi:site-specific integrase [Streptomyces sp. P1-3]|uniref:site-specific integrase n=1 Tax=Streptomyces sp. P1-3 TaxID=3421658 RepID=UPI003D369065
MTVDSHAVDPLMADLTELLIGTGIRKGEALGLHWEDVHLDERVLYIRRTLSAIDNELALTTPKTRSSKNWVAISNRVATALRHRPAPPRPGEVPLDGAETPGRLRLPPPRQPTAPPEYALNRFHLLSREARVPRATLHDLRHLAATISIHPGVPLTVVSKTLRHSTLSTTANISSHLNLRPLDPLALSVCQQVGRSGARRSYGPKLVPEPVKYTPEEAEWLEAAVCCSTALVEAPSPSRTGPADPTEGTFTEQHRLHARTTSPRLQPSANAAAAGGRTSTGTGTCRNTQRIPGFANRGSSAT